MNSTELKIETLFIEYCIIYLRIVLNEPSLEMYSQTKTTSSNQ
jgi:hypothetical protein